MTNIAVSPSPSKIVYTPRPNYATNEIVWGFWLTVEGKAPYYADWAMPDGQLVEMARYMWETERETAAYQYYMPYTDSMALRPVEVVEVEEDEESVQIDGRAYQVTDRLSIGQLPALAADLWRHDGVVAHVEVRRPRGRRPYIARQYADGSYSRPWRGSLFAN